MGRFNRIIHMVVVVVKPEQNPMTPDEYWAKKSWEEKVNEDCNAFLKTHAGLQYLMIKYPTLSLDIAVLEYKKAALKYVTNI